MSEKILFVDDDINILSALQRQLRVRFSLETAQGPAEGLSKIAKDGPYAVVVSDLRMPEMDGIQFLVQVHEKSPDTVRIMLTGNADINAAISAVNDGNIFRFLTKPVHPDVLVKMLEAAIQQYRLVIAERELLQKTLHGSIKVLVDVMSLVNPAAFSRASRIKLYVRRIAEQLDIPNVWQFELAAMLSQIGCVALPPGVLAKMSTGQPLTAEEQKKAASHPSIACNLLVNIPRLEGIARMIERQQLPLGGSERSSDWKRNDAVSMGAKMLKIALDYDSLISRGSRHDAAVQFLRSKPDVYDLSMVDALDRIDIAQTTMERRSIPISQLVTGMILDQDIQARDGTLLVAKRHEVTLTTIERLRAWAQSGEISESIRVLLPCDMAA